MRRDLHRQREWRMELERLRAGAAVGCLHVESRTMRSLLLPATMAATEQVHYVIYLSYCIIAARTPYQMCCCPPPYPPLSRCVHCNQVLPRALTTMCCLHGGCACCCCINTLWQAHVLALHPAHHLLSGHQPA